MRFFTRFVCCVSVLAAATGAVIRKPDHDKHWVATWTAMPQEVESSNLPPQPFGGLDAEYQFQNATLRQTVRVSIGGDRFRIQLSNLFGKTELHITAASVALPVDGGAGIGEVDTSTIQHLTFGGEASTIIMPDATRYTDLIHFPLKPLTNVAITLYTRDGQAGVNITGHPGSRTTSWVTAGNKVDSPSVAGGNTTHWYFISAVDTLAPRDTVGLVILGDSITDGRGSDDNQNNRWPDFLAERLQKSHSTRIAVNNEAAGGNAVLQGGLGPPLLQRYHRDALGQNGVKYVMIFEGVNDIGVSNPDNATQAKLFNDLIKAYTRIIADCKDAGLVTIGATITPFGGSQYADPMREKTRLRVNDWISNYSPFDHTVDFSAFIGVGDTLRPEFDSGDQLHPNVAAYREMAERIDLGIFH
ncbi:SGNH/GDSL hydrolase family protein [Aspergillus stella-maris]|uniref:SGNH/GDSL hydrolase family protein n=1 Tax=Aspergillus stella-maris TaxID=1810926 RepID=UPI003CCE022F